MPRKNIIEPWHEISNNQQSLRSACAYAHSDQSLCYLVARILYECLATNWTSFGICKLKRRLHRLVWVYTRQNATLCRGSIYDILASSRCVRYAGWYIHISKKRKNSDKYHKSSFSFSSSLKLFFCCFFHARHSYAIMFCVLSPLSCAQSHRVLPKS